MTDIVWAEDSGSDQFLIQAILDRVTPPLTVAFAEDGEAAVELARRHKPPLVVLDVKMPRVDGIDALRRLRSDPATATSDVIVFSSTGQPEEVDAIRDLGATGFVQKPIDFEGFSSAVRTIARKAVALVETRPRAGPPAHAHHVLFAESDRTLLQAAQRFLQEGRRQGRGLVVIATPAHIAHLQADLGEGDTVWVDTDTAAKAVYRDGRFQLTLFEGLVADAYQRASQGGRRPIAWFGELVDVLHADGLAEDALCIERFIQGAVREAGGKMEILCGYSFDAMTPEARRATASQHTDTW